MRIHPHWLVHFADRLLSCEAKRRIRLIQTALAILITLSGLGVMQYAAWAGAASWHPVLMWTLTALSGYVGFFSVIRSGWSERFADPSLTLAQMVYALGCCAGAYAIVGVMRGVVFPLVMVVLMFGMFALTPRKMLCISLYAVVLFGVLMWSMSRWHPDVFVPVVEGGHFLMLATMMPTMSVLAGQLSRLRVRLQQQKRDLADAFDRIQFLATRDALTALINRRQVSELLDAEQHRSTHTGASFCIALIDLDHFKRVNDNHGHGVGDEVLRAFAAEGTRQVRATDSLGRWGGEEFILLMPHSALPAAREGAERLRRAVEQMTISADRGVVRLTLSAGVVQHENGEPVSRLIERADVALYRAKSQGRNQVVLG